MKPLLPLLVEPFDLAAKLSTPELLIVDLSRAEVYARDHIPGAVHIDYGQIAVAQPPAMGAGALPDTAQLARVLGAIGFTNDRHVVACDNETGGRAARLLYTLDVLGHTRYSLLNGGLAAWREAHLPMASTVVTTTPSKFVAQIDERGIADKDYIRAHLGDPGVVIVDTRAPEEYQGTLLRAARGGHIPGAVNFNWIEATEPQHYQRLKPAEQLRHALRARGITPDKEIIVYCQTHHRSAHTYFVLKYLGYPRVRGYPGSWSEWGNLSDLPIE